MLHHLAKAVRQYTDAQPGQSPFTTPIQGVTILRAEHEQPPHHLIFKPALCIVAQGAKWAIFGEQRIDYRAGQALVVSVEIPGFGRVAEASPAQPFLGVIIEFDLAIMRQVVDALETPPQASQKTARSVFVTDFAGPLSDCALRMVRLLNTPAAIPVLYPSIMREICYWLLTGPHGDEILQMTLTSSHAHQVLHAIHLLRDRFAEPVRIEELALAAQMSPSAFHRQFKAATSMTPLQYQKKLRLLEARRLLVSQAINVESAAFQVGYESPSQFSREYSRMFATSPRRDAASLRTTAA